MKRLLLLLVVAALLVQPVFAFDPRRPDANRVTLLQAPVYGASELEARITRNVRERLLGELLPWVQYARDRAAAGAVAGDAATEIEQITAR